MTDELFQRWTAAQMCTHLQVRGPGYANPLNWSVEAVSSNAMSASLTPAPGVDLTVYRDGSVQLQGRKLRPALAHRLQQEALIHYHLLNGRVVLHGSSVEIEGTAAVIIGPSGAGKSTTADALLRRGAKLLSDDVVVIDEVAGQLVAVPTEARVRLKRESGAEPPSSPIVDAPQSGRASDARTATRVGEQVAVRAVVALTVSASANELQRKRLRGIAALEAVRELGGGQRGLHLQGPADFMAGLVRVVDGTEVWRFERTTQGPTPQELADHIMTILKGQRGV